MVRLEMIDVDTEAQTKQMPHDDLVTETSELQEEVEANCQRLFAAGKNAELDVHRHNAYLRRMLSPLPAGFVSLDASHPWLVYWPLNGLHLLGDPADDLVSGAAQAMLACVAPDGRGLGGGAGQLSHVAATYAGLNALALTGDEAAWAKIDPRAMHDWLLSLKAPDGSFAMSQGGETDPRAAYCALASAALLDVLTPELTAGVGEYIGSCQTYEGGFSNVPLVEAHGGYAFCALAALCLLGPPSETIPRHANVDLLVRWLSRRQYAIEGGFSGRTNKLVDACYSHWVGGCWALVEAALGASTTTASLWDRQSLERYIKVCCQDTHGGLRDKPGKRADAYHSNYALCGLAAAQHRYRFIPQQNARLGDFSFMWTSETLRPDPDVIAINPVHVLPEGAAERMRSYFKSRH